MISFPNAKINLGLYITKKRSDGFHNIETIFLPIPQLCDILEIIPRNNQEIDISFSQSGLTVEGDLESNLCIKAYRLLGNNVELPKIAMHLHKQIPMGAGLGGGSADGAFALKMINQLAEKSLPEKELDRLAAELGSDCPFFLINSPCFASGRGEVLETISLNVSNLFVALISPGIHVHTGRAYFNSKPLSASCNLKKIDQIPLERWKNLVSNDFEKIVFPDHPEIERIKKELYSLGAVYCSMSGSGSAVYGFFTNPPELNNIFEGMFTHISRIC